MSYCKGDVYMYQTGGGFVCHECKLWEWTDVHGNAGETVPEHLSPIYDNRLAAIDHLRLHLTKGHKVEPRAFIRLWREIELNKEDVVGK